MKKLLFVHTPITYSGAEISLTDLINFLKGEYHISAALSSGSQIQKKLTTICDIYPFHFPVIIKSSNPLVLVKQLFQVITNVIKLVKLVRQEQYEIVYFNGYQSGLYCIPVKIFTNKKTIWHVRDHLRFKLLASILGYCADRIICISYFVAGQLPFHYKKVVVYNGINTFKLRPQHQLSDQVTITQIGQLIAWKNHHLFIELAYDFVTRHPNLHFIILGEAVSPSYYQQLQQLIHQYGLSEKLSIIEFQPDIIPYLAKTDILVHLAAEEPLGRVLLEAMAMGKPVLAINNGGPAEIVQHGYTGFLADTQDKEAISQYLDRLICSPELRQTMGINGRKVVERKFSFKNFEKIKDVIKEVG